MNLYVDEIAFRKFIMSITLLVNSLVIDELNRMFILNDFSQSKQNFFINHEFFNIHIAVSFHASYTNVIKVIIKLFTTISEL